MASLNKILLLGLLAGGLNVAAQPDTPLVDEKQTLERTCFQSYAPYSDDYNLGADVAIVYGIDKGLPDRIKTWKDKGYRIHVMTGVSWGNYQDYLYGRFDGVNHEDEAQTRDDGQKISHGGDVYYMSPGENYGKFLCVGVKRAMDAGAEAIFLEEPEFWVAAGYSEGFKKEWSNYYNLDWQPQNKSIDAAWRSAKLKYYLYRRALQQVFDFIQQYNSENNRTVRCYVPTHSMINYAHWRIVSPESSLARIKGCDGYIAQVWTGTARTPNFYNGTLAERTFEYAFLEYSSMYNLVRSTGRTVWYLNDPIEDNPNHDWTDYRTNWESTLTASLLQPEVWRYEVMPWPDRVFRGKYPSNAPAEQQRGIPAEYATELQVVMSALKDMNQSDWEWDHPSDKVGQVVSDSLMFERGIEGSDPHMGHVYGMALPFVKRGIPLEMVQLENVTIPDYLKRYKLITLTYNGQKPLSPDVHKPIAEWVKKGGILLIVDDDSDPYNAVPEWWNTGNLTYKTPRHHLMELMGLNADTTPGVYKFGKGMVCYENANPWKITQSADGDEEFMNLVHSVVKKRVELQERSCLALRRGPYFIAAGLTESVEEDPWGVDGRFVNLFDPELKLLKAVDFTPGSRYFLLNLDKAQDKTDKPKILAAGCKALPVSSEQAKENHGTFTCQIEGIANTQGILLLSMPNAASEITLDGEKIETFQEDVMGRLLWVKFPNKAVARKLVIKY